MTSGRMLRPVLVCLFALSGAGCTMVEGDPHRFEKLAQGIADIPLDGARHAPRSAADAGLRPAVRVEVLDPHDLWDARDGIMRQTVERAAPAVVEAAAPVVAQAMVDRFERQLISETTGSETTNPVVVGQDQGQAIQLGAYSSEAAAQAAWAGFTTGRARAVLSDLQPRYEQAEVNGRSVVRLKVLAPAERVGPVCRATQIVAPWCASAG